jgi:NADPH-ferrihemoprotein reductase
LHIYFASQTGTAEGFARQLADEGKAKGFNAKSVDLDDVEPDELAEKKLAIFMIATYGEGEPTDNSARFIKWMKTMSKDRETPYEAMNYSVFGLGNRQYEHFNAMGKLTNTMLQKLGGKEAYEYGEGDDDGTLEEDFESWKEKLWTALVNKYHPDAAQVSTKDDEVTKVTLEFTADPIEANDAQAILKKSIATRFPSNKINNSTRHFFEPNEFVVSTNRELRSVSPGDPLVTGSTRHMEFEIANDDLKYLTADNLAIMAPNNAAMVEAFAASLGYDLDSYFQIAPTEGNNDHKALFPTPCTVREALTNYIDIQGALRYATVQKLLPYVEDSSQKEWLVNLTSKENRAAFGDFVSSGQSLHRLLTAELSSCKLPLSDLLHIASVIQPRYYTISSSSSCHPRHIHATVSVTAIPTPGGNIRGLCSGYCFDLAPGTKCMGFVRPSSFRLPADPSTPIVMIGPGTGIAPMRALLQERSFQRAANGRTDYGANVLYFGCRKSTEDYIYKDELEGFVQSKVLSKLHVAFSREGKEKVYVQNLIARPDNAAQLVKDIDAGGYIYVCGATAMGNDVLAAVTSILQSVKGVSAEAATQTVKKLQADGRYVQELWTA